MNYEFTLAVDRDPINVVHGCREADPFIAVLIAAIEEVASTGLVVFRYRA